MTTTPLFEYNTPVIYEYDTQLLVARGITVRTSPHRHVRTFYLSHGFRLKERLLAVQL